MKTECIGGKVRYGDKYYPCTVSLAMDLIGGKWKTVILYHLRDSKKRFSELRREMGDVTEMTLSIQLKQLENAGLISKTIYGEKAPFRVEYMLTAFGQTLIPLLNAVLAWGNEVATQKGELIR